MDSVVFRLGEKAPDIVREVCLERGWEEYREDECEEDGDGGWNLWWKTQGFTSSEYQTCRPWQRLNHFPKSSNITKKDGLARNLRRMKTSYGATMFDFFPQTFILPNEYKKFVAEFSKQEGDQESNYWICKPTEQSCGRGIFIFQDLCDLSYHCSVVVQKYIIKPFLISGYKFDLRLYVIVKSFHPFQLYIYHEGIVRFSTERFDMSKLNNRFSHLTNTTINKTGPQYSAEKESIGFGCKWTLSQLRVYLQKLNIDDRMLWHSITTIVILTLLSQVQDIPDDTSNCFEMFGFDILVDENLKPWLLEVNSSPALCKDCSQDDIVKRPLLNDILEILNFSEVDMRRGGVKENGVTKKKRYMKCHAPKNFHKPLYSKHVLQQSSKTSLNISAGGIESDLKTESKLREKGSLFQKNDEKERNSFQRSQKACSKVRHLSNKERQSSSKEFLTASMDNWNDLVKLTSEKGNSKEEEEVPLEDFSKKEVSDCSKLVNGTRKDEEEQSSLSKEAEDEKDDSLKSCLVEDEVIMKVPTDLSSLKQNRVEKSCCLCVHCYKSDMSFINSMKTFDNAPCHSRSAYSGHSSLPFSSKVPKKLVSHKKATFDTLKPRIGNCILVFPFSAATLKASCQGKLDQKIVIAEIRKMLRAISREIKLSSSYASNNSKTLDDLSTPFWGYRSSLNSFYATLQLKIYQKTK